MGFRVERIETPPCSRCGEQLLMAASPPPGVDVPLLELCVRCDGGSDSTAGRLVAALTVELTDANARVVSDLVVVWYREVMASQGWRQGPSEEESFAAWERELAPDPPGPLSPEAEERILGLFQRLRQADADSEE